MKRILLGIAAIAVLVFCSSVFRDGRTLSETGSGNQLQQKQKVVISEAFELFLHAPLWVAYEKGYFQDEGLDVTITIAGGDEKTFASVLSGDADFSVGDPVFAAISGEQGRPGVVVAAMLNGAPFWGVAKDPGIPVITEPSMLRGHSVATLPSPSTNYALQKKMFLSAGLKPEIREVGFEGGLLPALDSGQADIALEFEPNVSMAIANGDHIVYSLADYYPAFAFTGMTTSPEYVTDHPGTVKKITNALKKASTLIINDPREAALALTQHFAQVDPSVAENALKNMVSSNIIIPDTVTSKAAWDAAIQARVAVGDLRATAPYEQYVLAGSGGQPE